MVEKQKEIEYVFTWLPDRNIAHFYLVWPNSVSSNKIVPRFIGFISQNFCLHNHHTFIAFQFTMFKIWLNKSLHYIKQSHYIALFCVFLSRRIPTQHFHKKLIYIRFCATELSTLESARSQTSDRAGKCDMIFRTGRAGR